MIQLRMDRRLKGRVDESDVIQEAFSEAATRFETFCNEGTDCSPFIWLRFLTLQKLAQIHRHHIKVQRRSILKEVRRTPLECAATSAVMAVDFSGNKSTPLDAILRDELRQSVTQALDGLKEEDREILAMRHFEQLSNAEVAEAIGISPNSAYKRYSRALGRLRLQLAQLPINVSGLDSP